MTAMTIAAIIMSAGAHASPGPDAVNFKGNLTVNHAVNPAGLSADWTTSDTANFGIDEDDDDDKVIDLTSMDSVIDGDPRILAEGFRFIEGPLWVKDITHPGGGRLIFCDLGGDAVHVWTPHDVTLAAGDVSDYRRPSDRAAGAALAPNGDVIITHFGRTLTAQDADGTVRTIASTVGGKQLNSPNDLAIRSDGMIYFTDPAFGTRGPAREIDVEGVYLIKPTNKPGQYAEPILLTDELSRPNGCVLSRDEKTLYVTDSATSKLWAFTVKADGTLTDGRVLADMNVAETETVPEGATRRGLADGLTVDAVGRIYAAGPGGIGVWTSEGQLVGRIWSLQGASNATIGGPRGDTLFVTARDKLFAVQLHESAWIAATPVPPPAVKNNHNNIDDKPPASR